MALESGASISLFVPVRHLTNAWRCRIFITDLADTQIHPWLGLLSAIGKSFLNRPDRLNAVHPEMGNTLRLAFLDLEADPEIRAIVLTGRGRAFCAGADISGDTGNAEAVLRDIWNPLITTMLELDVPIIAALNGVAAGAGASLAFASDLRVAASSARFQLSFVKIGLMPDSGATWHSPGKNARHSSSASLL